MKVLKIIGKIIGGLLILLVLGIGLLYLMRDRIAAGVAHALEDYYHIELEYTAVSISVFKNFPKLSLGVKDLSISQADQDVNLAQLKELNVAVDFYSLWNSSEPLRIHAFTLNEPHLLYEVYADSTSNWDIFFDSAEEQDTSEKESLVFSLNHYEIIAGHLIYIDAPGNNSIELIQINHSGSGDLSSTTFDLKTETSIDSIFYHSEGMDFLAGYPVIFNALIHVNTEEQVYQLDEAEFRFADLITLLSGEITGADAGYSIDINIKESASDIKQLLSFMPEQMTRDYQDIQTSGKLSLRGTINGLYNSTQSIYPAMDIQAEVVDGQIQYPTLPEQIKDITIQSKITKPEGDLNLLEIGINPLSFRIGDNPPLLMRLAVRDLFHGPQVSGELRGSLNLNSLFTAIPLETVNSMSGDLSMDFLFDIFYPDIAQENYEKVKLDGDLSMRSVEITTTSFPKVEISEAKAGVSNSLLDIENIKMTIGRSDFAGNFQLDNPIAIMSKGNILKAKAELLSSLTDVNELMGADDGKQEQTSSEESMVPALFERLDFSGKFKAEKVIYDSYIIEKVNALIRIKDGNIALSNATFTYEASPYTANGNFYNTMNYLYKEEGDLTGDLNIQGEKFDLWKYMNTETDEGSSGNEEILSLPERIDLNISAKIGTIAYDNYDIQQLNTHLRLYDQKVLINKGTGRLFNGLISLTGTFEATGKALPSYDFNYSMKKIAFAQAYNNIITFKKLAPIAEFLQGFFDAELKIKGELTKDLMPNLNTIDLAGIIETTEAKLQNYPGLNAITDKLQIRSFKEVSLDNTRNYIDIKHGEFSVQPFAVELGEIDATVQGSQKITGAIINYTMSSKIPREWLDKNSISKQVNKGFDWLEEQAAQRGINLNAGDYIYVDMLLSGSLKNPKVALQLKDIAGKSLKESAKDKIKEEARNVQDSIKRALQKERTEMEMQARNRMDSIKRAAEEEARKKAKEILTGKKDTTDNSLEEEFDKAGKDAKKKIDDIRDKFKKWKNN